VASGEWRMTSEDSERRVERRVVNGEWQVAAAVRVGEPELTLFWSAAGQVRRVARG